MNHLRSKRVKTSLLSSSSKALQDRHRDSRAALNLESRPKLFLVYFQNRVLVLLLTFYIFNEELNCWHCCVASMCCWCPAEKFCITFYDSSLNDLAVFSGTQNLSGFSFFAWNSEILIHFSFTSIGWKIVIHYETTKINQKAFARSALRASLTPL